MLRKFDEIMQDFDYHRYNTEFKALKNQKKISDIFALFALILLITVLILVAFMPTLIIVWGIIVFLFVLAFFIMRKFVFPQEWSESEFRDKIIMDFVEHVDENIHFYTSNEDLEKIFIDSCVIDDVYSDKISSSDSIETSLNGKYFALGEISTWIGSSKNVITSFNGVFAVIELNNKHQRILLLPKTKLDKRELKASEIKYSKKIFYRQKNEDTEKYTVWTESKVLINAILNPRIKDFLDSIDEQKKIGFSLYDNKLCLADYQLYSSVFPLSVYDLSEFFFRDIYDKYVFYFSLINQIAELFDDNETIW
jgi:hypothetical protein